jgi:hypothetical protein
VDVYWFPNMLPENLKSDVLELAAIAQECPESLRNKCFELLLTQYLRNVEVGEQGAAKRTGEVGGLVSPRPVEPAEDNGTVLPSAEALPPTPPSQEDITAAHIHIRARKFLEKYELTIADLNQLFYRDAEEFRPLYEDLKTTKSAESQIRIALLQALISGMKSGEFQFDGEVVRKECQTRKCYDVANFSANLKNNATLFDTFEKYEKQSPLIKLSEAGREQLAVLIRALR